MLELSYKFQTMFFQPKNCWSTVQLLFILFALWPFLDVIKYLGLQFKYYANFILIGDKIFFNIFSLLKSRLDERPEGWVDISNISGREWTLGCLLHWPPKSYNNVFLFFDLTYLGIFIKFWLVGSFSWVSKRFNL